MKYKFENIFLDEKELMSLNSEMIDPILIENNQTQLKEVYEFYKNEMYGIYAKCIFPIMNKFFYKDVVFKILCD